MSTQQYTITESYWNGSKLTESTTVKVSRMSNAQIIETIARGFAGISPGAARIEVTIDSAMPAADLELNPGPFIKKNEAGELTLYASGRTLSSKGFMMSDDVSGGVNSPSTISFTFIGEYAEWEA